MKLRLLALSLCIVSVVALQPIAQAKDSAPAAPLYQGITAAELSHQQPIHWVSVAQIKNSL